MSQSSHSASKSTAAQEAADAITFFWQVIGTYRPGSPELAGAANAVADAVSAALAAGATEDDIRAATTGPVLF
jgi:uncharacterized phage infection (PIP) family protein YhgE